VYYVDGRFVPAGKAALPLDDLAILRGFGVFEFLRTYGGKPFHLAEHLKRLRRSATLIGIRLPWSERELARIVEGTLRRNRFPEANIRVVVTGGASADFITPSGTPRLIVTVVPLMRYPARWYSRGVKVVTVPAEPYIPEAKTLNYLAAVIAIRRARARGAVEAISVDREGMVLEGKTTNIFAFIEGTLVTTARKILPGVTRHLILKRVRGVFPVEVRAMTREDLLGADEVFITATNKGIVPVVRVDDRVIGKGVPGPRTRRVMGIFAEETARFNHDLDARSRSPFCAGE
jgi:branched-chain amino acid aminotransferase